MSTLDAPSPNPIPVQPGMNNTGSLVVSTAMTVNEGFTDRAGKLQDYIDRLMKMDNFFDEVEVLLRKNFFLEIAKIHTILSTSLNTREASSDYIEEPQQDTTSDDVTKAFRRISMLTHPDRNIGKTDNQRSALEELFKEAKEAYKSGKQFTVMQILQKLGGQEISIEKLEQEFHDLFTKVIYKRNFLGIEYVDAYMTVAYIASNIPELITSDRVYGFMERKVRGQIDVFLSQQQK